MKFFNKIKDNKASITFNRVICYFMLFIVTMFSIDVALFFTQTVVTSYQTAFFAEKISVQGGLLGDEHILPGPINGTKPCKSCYTNKDISDNFNKTMKNFDLKPVDWTIQLIDENDAGIWIHSNGRTVNSTQKYRLPYLSVNNLAINCKFNPKVSGFLWDGAMISKNITFISEYIER